jgi:hypothetical protein
MDRSALRQALLALAAVDVAATAAGLLRGGGDLPNMPNMPDLPDLPGSFCQPEIAGSRAPFVAFRRGWCPGLVAMAKKSPEMKAGGDDKGQCQPDQQSPHEKPAVPNDVALAWPARKGMLLTGANATGKSTVLRLLGQCLLMGQSLGVVPAASAVLTPMAYVCTMMRVRDSPERGMSRFQAELMRAGNCMDTATACARRGAGGVVLLDEVFAGSSDASSSDACGSRVLDVLCRSTGALVVLSTHQASLADWASRAEGFEAWRMLPEGYMLVPGRNSASNAAEQMRLITSHSMKPP